MQHPLLFVLLFLLRTVLIAAYGDEAAPCPNPDWMYHEETNRCFFLKDSNAMSFFEAQQYCERNSHKMAIAKTQDVVEFLSDKLLNVADVWLGLTDNGDKQNPTWSDGSKLEPPLQWDTENGYPKLGGSGTQCVYLHPKKRKWRDKNCFERILKTLCEASEASKCTSSPGLCDHICHDIGFRMHECECLPGYDMQEQTCVDINECDYNNGGCEHVCNNTIGSYSCLCNKGFSELGGRVCRDKDEAAKELKTMELVSLAITLCFPVFSAFGCVGLSVWRQRKLKGLKMTNASSVMERPSNMDEEYSDVEDEAASVEEEAVKEEEGGVPDVADGAESAKSSSKSK